MNVVHLYDGHERVHDGKGSVPGVVWNVARETARAGHDVTVIERQWEGLEPTAEHDGVAFHRLDLRTGATEPWDRVPYEMVESPVGLARLVGDRLNFAATAFRRLRHTEFDVLHVHLPFAANVLLSVAPSLRDRTVYTAHLGETRLDALSEDQSGDDAEGSGIGGLGPPAVLQLVSPDVFLARRVAHTVVLNDDIREVFASKGVAHDALSVIPNGVDVRRFADPDLAELDEIRRACGFDDGPVVLFVGTVMPRKGVDDLVRAAAELVGERGHTDVQFVVAGEDDLDGEYVERLEAMIAEAGVGDHVTLTGFVPGEWLPQLYARADVFAMPSREEGFGMTVTEAMAAGTPVVATRVGGVPDLVDENEQGFLVEPNAHGALADAIAELLADRDRAERMAARSRERARRYAWEEVGSQYVSVYESVVGTDSGSR